MRNLFRAKVISKQIWVTTEGRAARPQYGLMYFCPTRVLEWKWSILDLPASKRWAVSACRSATGKVSVHPQYFSVPEGAFSLEHLDKQGSCRLFRQSFGKTRRCRPAVIYCWCLWRFKLSKTLDFNLSLPWWYTCWEPSLKYFLQTRLWSNCFSLGLSFLAFNVWEQSQSNRRPNLILDPLKRVSRCKHDATISVKTPRNLSNA